MIHVRHRWLLSCSLAAAVPCWAASSTAKDTPAVPAGQADPATNPVENQRVRAISALVAQGRNVEAATAAADALGGGANPSEVEQRLRALLLEAKKHVTTVVVRAPAGTTVQIDGIARTSAPVKAPLYLDPGRHSFDGSHPSWQFAQMTHDLKAGQTIAIVLKGTEWIAPPEKPLWPALVIGGVGLAALGVGAGLLAASLDAESEAELLASSIDRCVVDNLDAPCQRLTSVIIDRNSYLNGATVSFVVGGVAALSTIAYLIVPTPDDRPEVSFAPLLSPSFAGATLGGHF